MAQACKEAGIVEQTYYRWRKESAGGQARRLKELEQENSKLRWLVSELSLECLTLKDIAALKILSALNEALVWRSERVPSTG